MSLSRFFNKPKVYQPAIELEKTYGLSAIAAHYRAPQHILPGFGKMLDALCTRTVEQCYESAFEGSCIPKAYIKQIKQPSTSIIKCMEHRWQVLKAANPELERVAINRDDPGEFYDAFAGVKSGFNADDIQFFLQARRTSCSDVKAVNTCENLEHYNPAYLKDCENLKKRLGHHIDWFPAPETLKKIDRQLSM